VLSVTSLLVTLLVQALASFLALRGTNLRWGVATLLRELDATGKLTAPNAEKIASAVLSHPLISDSTAFGRIFGKFIGGESKWVGKWKLATAIRADELGAILAKLEKQPATNAWNAFVRALPAGANAQVQATIQDVEKWFDSTMDRVSQRFATHTRVATIAFSFVVALALHVDVLGIYTRLANDAPLRALFVAQAMSVAETEQPKPTEATEPKEPNPPAAAAAPEEQREVAKAATNAAADQLRAALNTLGPLGFLPKRPAEILCFRDVSILGILLGGMLLSLGAPFWFNMLRTLTSLRPILAKKVDEEPRAAP
jgi:hypothetical protein